MTGGKRLERQDKTLREGQTSGKQQPNDRLRTERRGKRELHKLIQYL
jgi:hypothetical protein